MKLYAVSPKNGHVQSEEGKELLQVFFACWKSEYGESTYGIRHIKASCSPYRIGACRDRCKCKRT